MNPQPSSVGSSRQVEESSSRRPGRHARPVALPVRPVPDMIRDGSLERLGTADRALADAHARLRASGADSDAVSAAFAIARDCLREARDLVRESRRELALVTYEMEERHGRRGDRHPQAERHPQALVYPQASAPVIPDSPGVDLCPDPSVAQTAAQYMDILRRYRMWAGQPSYRTMRDAGGKRFATSTIHAALSGEELPKLPMVHAVITGCGGTETHQQAFASAWRRLVMSVQDGVPAVPPARDPLAALAR